VLEVEFTQFDVQSTSPLLTFGTHVCTHASSRPIGFSDFLSSISNITEMGQTQTLINLVILFYLCMIRCDFPMSSVVEITKERATQSFFLNRSQFGKTEAVIFHLPSDIWISTPKAQNRHHKKEKKRLSSDRWSKIAPSSKSNTRTGHRLTTLCVTPKSNKA
jgi:hypothetical protein